MRPIRQTALVVLALLLSSCGRHAAQSVGEEPRPSGVPSNAPGASPRGADGPSTREVATLGGGCFWCVEAVMRELDGVERVTSGYAGGTVANPTYAQVCEGTTGHAEVVQVTFDPAKISYHDLLVVFLTTHDPTTLNRQGADVGTQYRSVIFYHGEAQRATAETVKAQLQPHFDAPIVTEISAAPTFYPAEDYHQNYYALNSGQGYCRAVISPKLAKLRSLYRDRLKKP